MQDLASLLWVINLGCIDLNQWYARCDDVDRPDYLHFDLDPGEGATFEQVRETGFVVRDALDALAHADAASRRPAPAVCTSTCRSSAARAEGGVDSLPRRSRMELAARHPALMTAEYRVAKRPKGRVLVDYNQNAWGRTLASIYSVRPRPRATGLDPDHLGGTRVGRRDRRLPD